MRRPDWPEKLAAAIAAARDKPFSEDYYCVTLAADCLLAMTDEDPLAPYRGLSMADALAQVKAEGYRSFYFYMVRHYGRPVPVSFAGRGDIVVRTDPELVVGICCGMKSAFASDIGVAYQETLDQRWCFKVP